MKKTFLLILSTTLIMGISIFMVLGFIDSGAYCITGKELAEMLEKNVGGSDLIIYAERRLPGALDEKYGYPLYDYPTAYDSLYIFNDGVIFAGQGYNSDKSAQRATIEGVKFDDTWIHNETRPGGMSRRVKAYISQGDMIDLLSYLSQVEGELLQGETVDDIPFGGWVRVIYKGREGLLYEQEGTRVADEDRRAFIYGFIDLVKEKIEAVGVEKVDPAQWHKELEAKKEEFHWFYSTIRPKYSGLTEAWDAHGLEYSIDK